MKDDLKSAVLLRSKRLRRYERNVMSRYAQISKDNVITQIITADEVFIHSGAVGNPKLWVELTPMRDGSFPKLGYRYDRRRKIFINPPPYGSWVLDEKHGKWKAPVEQPVVAEGQSTVWNEDRVGWDVVGEPVRTNKPRTTRSRVKKDEGVEAEEESPDN